MKQNQIILLVVCILVCLSALYQADLTYDAIEMFGKPEQLVFNRTVYLTAINFAIIGFASLLFPFQKWAAIAIAVCCFLSINGYHYILGGEFKLYQGWFTLIPISGLLVIAVEKIWEKKNA